MKPRENTPCGRSGTRDVFRPAICGNPVNLRHLPLSAFSLVEVVLALGIVSFALMGIMAVTSSSLSSNKDSHEISEELLVAKSLPSFLQANGTNPFQAYTNASNWAVAGYSNIFACSTTNGGTNQILITTNTGVTTSGRLFRITLATNAILPTASNAAMGLRVSIQAVPDTTTVPRNNSSHVYDTAILP